MRKFLFLTILLILGPFMFYQDGQIGTDLKIRGEPLDIANIATSNRKCTAYVFFFQECSFGYRLNGEYQHQSYFFLSFGAPKTIRLLRGRSSGNITSTVGQDYIWNRIFSILLFLFTGLVVLTNFYFQYLSPRNNRSGLKPGTQYTGQKKPQAQGDVMNAGVSEPIQTSFGRRTD